MEKKYPVTDLLVLIPARAGSKGVKSKNFRKIGDKSLVERSMIHASYFADIADVVVSTDYSPLINSLMSIETISVGKSYGEPEFYENSWGFLHKRSKKLSSDESLIMDLIHYLVFESELSKSRNYRAVLLLQPTTPFRSVEELNFVKEVLLNDKDTSQSFVSLRDVTDTHPARMYSMQGGDTFRGIGCYADFRHHRRQDCPKVFIRDGGYYIIGKDLIRTRTQARQDVRGMVREFPYSINIDSESDFALAALSIDKYTNDPNELSKE